MRKAIMFLGTMLITIMIIISGPAVAVMVYAISVEDYYQCTNPNNALYSPDNNYATLGVDTPSQRLGWIILDLGSSNMMGANQDFTVYGYADGCNETYWINVLDEYMNDHNSSGWSGYDTADLIFTTPSTPSVNWRYFEIHGQSGYICFEHPDDNIYGPEIDAVGWDKP